jgi:hypothetical protein
VVGEQNFVGYFVRYFGCCALPFTLFHWLSAVGLDHLIDNVVNILEGTYSQNFFDFFLSLNLFLL